MSKTFFFTSSFRIVFSNPIYIIISLLVATFFWIILNVAGELLFFYPIWIFYFPDDAKFGFILTNITVAFIGIVISMNIYIIKNLKIKLSRSLFSGASIGLISSTCASCSSIGFALVSTFGGIGILISNFFSVYEIPLRIISIAILVYAIYSLHNRITKSCYLISSKSKESAK
ncbi:MAG TPA: hypothetical protein VJ697_09395 [Nitrososphaeraceae archaeon]|nr:hypothetical protein [Nitrososphaeraceae archaeon]